jgi:hydrogenase maturation protease
MRSLVSAHSIIGIEGGEFISLLDPPDELRDFSAACQNIGTWPVLVGEDGQRDAMLSSPIILYDYPKIAPESPGALFDGTEIDEILTLRILTLTDEEKREISSSDERARQILERTESMPAEQFMKMHGVVRCLREVQEQMP